MKVQKIKLVYFSPTGTTKAVVQGISSGIDSGLIENIDITSPEARQKPLETGEDELLIIGAPVYMGRIPALLGEWFLNFKGHNTLAVPVVVYGNRAYEDALLELKDNLLKCGCRPFAGGAFIGEHSFSSDENPIAEGRPDLDDLNYAKAFGEKVNKILKTISSSSFIPEVNFPGNFPYGGITELWSVDFIEVNGECKQCGICADLCPVGAISMEDSGLIDKVKCITCCACIKYCPESARIMKSGPVMDAAMRLNNLYGARKEPKYFV